MDLTKSKLVGIKLETTPGVRETLTAADYGLEVSELSIVSNLETIESEVYKGSISKSPSRVGKAPGAATIGGEFKNSGTLNVDPQVAKILKTSRAVEHQVIGMAISGVTGTISRGLSVITGSVSLATGIALAVEGSKLYVAVTSGAFASGDALTSFPAGFVATAGAQDAADTGTAYILKTTDASEKCATIDVNDSGIFKSIYGSASNFALSLSTEAEPKFTATFAGITYRPTWGQAASEVTGIVYEDSAASIVSNANILINGTISPITASVTIDFGNVSAAIPNLSSDTWLHPAAVSDRNVNGTMTFLHLDPATYNLWAAWFAGAPASLEFKIGSGAGNQIEVIMPYIQYMTITDTDQNGFAANTVNYSARGTENEITIWFR